MKHDGCVRGFTHTGQAWYGKSALMHRDGVVDELMVGMYHPLGGTTGEFAIRWSPVGGHLTARLEAFNDSWNALLQFSDLLSWMATMDEKRPEPTEFADALRALGVKDMTERVSPHESDGDRELASWFRAKGGAA